MIQSTITHIIAWLKHLPLAPRRSALQNVTIYQASHLRFVKEGGLPAAPRKANGKNFRPLRPLIIVGNHYWAGVRRRHERLLGQSVTVFALLLLLFLLFIFSMDSAVAQADLPTNLTPAAANELGRNLERRAPSRAPRYLLQEQVSAAQMRTVVELPAVADSYIASARPEQNFGGDSLYLGYSQLGDGFGAERLMVRFDIAANIPANATINSARLRLRLAFSSPTADAAMPTVLRRLASHWNESTVTWNREPSWTDIDDRTSVGSALDWYEWEVRDQVAGWVSGTANHGVEIIGDERLQERERAFYSRETNTNFFPRLVVDYTVVQDDEPPTISVDPLPTYVGRNFVVSWSGDDPGAAGIDYYDVQYRMNDGDWIDWVSGVETTAEEFPNGQNGRYYQFRARGVDEAGNVEPFGDPEAATTVDTQPPTSTILPLPAVVGVASFTVAWRGSDGGGAGIQYYDVRYRVNGGGWILWQQQTRATSALFTAPTDGVYGFEARAIDNRGMVEPFQDEEATVAVDTEAPFLQIQAWLPLIRHYEAVR